MPTAETSTDRRQSASARVVALLVGPPAERAFAVRYWDGTVEEPPAPPRFTLVVERPSALRRMLLPPSELSICEAFIFGDVDVEGDLESATAIGDAVAGRLRSARAVARLVRALHALPAEDAPADSMPAGDARRAQGLRRIGRRHSARRDAAAVRFHYDLGNDFYALWLDRHMAYSCAYFERPGISLDEAQEAKFEHVCRKLRLRPGERLLDIGCGWGGLLAYAASRYGVTGVGITLSEPQAARARERLAAAGLADRVRIEVRDYRAVDQPEGFDKIASIGMVEHVGRSRLRTYFAAAHRLLRPGGLFLNHGIVGIACARPVRRLDDIGGWLWKRDQFIYRYVFPDGLLVPLADVLGAAEWAGFETRDVESLREHYALTLRHWVRRLEACHAAARRLVGEATYRVWRLYMAASASGFAAGRLGIDQTLLSKPTREGASGLPLTRRDLYE